MIHAIDTAVGSLLATVICGLLLRNAFLITWGWPERVDRYEKYFRILLIGYFATISVPQAPYFHWLEIQFIAPNSYFNEEVAVVMFVLAIRFFDLGLAHACMYSKKLKDRFTIRKVSVDYILSVLGENMIRNEYSSITANGKIYIGLVHGIDMWNFNWIYIIPLNEYDLQNKTNIMFFNKPQDIEQETIKESGKFIIRKDDITSVQSPDIASKIILQHQMVKTN